MVNAQNKQQEVVKLNDRFATHFQNIYGEDRVEECMKRIRDLISQYKPYIEVPPNSGDKWSEEDSILITYGDVLRDLNNPSEPRLNLLEQFLDQYVSDAISSVHILPFFPSSSDAGFSVINYKQVRLDLGNWHNIERLSGKYRLMADLVINHTSRYSRWFQNYTKKEEPGKDYFLETDPELDLSEVVRPRNSPLLSPVKTEKGTRCVWTTFSEDQVDVDFSNPDVLFEYLDIFLYYISEGIQTVRLDAIAYLWKRIGTSCIHLPETHEVVKLYRTLVEEVAPHVTLITETNVPHKENISYFGNGDDEAHMVYQFSLPPLLLHALLTNNSKYLTEWADSLDGKRKGCYFMNFTASHDGIGVRPLEGLVPQGEFDYMVREVYKREGFVSYKKNKDGSESPYELNITYFDAFADLDSDDDVMQVKRYLCSQSVMLALKGVPGIYFHNLTATTNDTVGVLSTGDKRSINRMQWEYEDLLNRLQDEKTTTSYVMKKYKQMLRVRSEHPAFHPDAPQEVFKCDKRLFVLQRTALDGSETILSISNFSEKTVSISQIKLPLPETFKSYPNVLGDSRRGGSGFFFVKPFETLWLAY